jgi:hypothetical protein
LAATNSSGMIPGSSNYSLTGEKSWLPAGSIPRGRTSATFFVDCDVKSGIITAKSGFARWLKPLA